VEALLLVCKLFAQVFFLGLLPRPFLCIGRITIGLSPFVSFPVTLLRFLHLLHLLLEQRDAHGIEILHSNTLADGNEKRRVEDGPVGEFTESDKVLHIGIFPNHLYGLLV
jgi:hypothetical protein